MQDGEERYIFNPLEASNTPVCGWKLAPDTYNRIVHVLPSNHIFSKTLCAFI